MVSIIENFINKLFITLLLFIWFASTITMTVTIIGTLVMMENEDLWFGYPKQLLNK